jgi:hypothetical protein
LPAPANNFVPSDDEVTEVQLLVGALVRLQVAPELVEVQISPWPAAATNLIPSADEATAAQPPLGAVVGAQVTPESSDL